MKQDKYYTPAKEKLLVALDELITREEIAEDIVKDLYWLVENENHRALNKSLRILFLISVLVDKANIRRIKELQQICDYIFILTRDEAKVEEERERIEELIKIYLQVKGY